MCVEHYLKSSIVYDTETTVWIGSSIWIVKVIELYKCQLRPLSGQIVKVFELYVSRDPWAVES